VDLVWAHSIKGAMTALPDKHSGGGYMSTDEEDDQRETMKVWEWNLPPH